MGKMMGRDAYRGLFCTCCNDPRTHGQQRAREDEEMRAYVSALWAEDWDSPEDGIYDTWGSE